MRIGAGGGSTEERIAEPIGGLHGVLTGGRTDVDAPATRAWSEQLSLTDGTSCMLADGSGENASSLPSRTRLTVRLSTRAAAICVRP